VSGTVVVIGATSYAGGRLIPDLLQAGHRVVAVSRRPNLARIFLPENSEQLVISSADEAPRLCKGDSFSLVNLGYVMAALPHRRFKRDRELAQSISAVAAGGCDRIVHVSTAAVFGYTFAQQPRPVRVRWRPMESLYAESKIRAEHLIERAARRVGCELAIIRLGNLIGPGSPAWVARPAQRIMEMQPLCYEGAEGFSNATHVNNVSQYIGHLLDQPEGTLQEFGTYHHLAEFSSHRWPELFDVMSEVVGCPWVSVRRPRRERGPRIRRVLGAAYATRVGGYARAASAWLPASDRLDRWVAEKRAPRPSEGGAPDPVGVEDEGLLSLFSSAVEFRSATIDGWCQKTDFPSACAGIADWLRASGYSLRQTGADEGQGTPRPLQAGTPAADRGD
jgi:nucleoside-diphosphate-sugar epimerase